MSPAKVIRFDPDRVAQLEADGWRAYYDHAWLRFLRLIVAATQTQFHVPFPMSLLAAYYITRSAAAWVRVDHDRTAIRALHERYYRMTRRYSGLAFDPARAALLEEQYWDVHRRLSGQPDKTEFVETMVALHSELFGLSPEAARPSAELRVEANNKVDLITSRQAADPEATWRALTEDLRGCYRSIQAAMGGSAYPSP